MPEDWMAKAEPVAREIARLHYQLPHPGYGEDALARLAKDRIARALEEAEIRGKDKTAKVALDILRERRAGEARFRKAYTAGRREGIEEAAKLMEGPGQGLEAWQSAPETFCRWVDHAQDMCECAERAAGIRALLPPEAK